jgi:hypothetical protein
MSRLALIFAAVLIGVSGFAFGASMAIGPRGVAEVALGTSIGTPFPERVPVLAEAEPAERPWSARQTRPW